MIPSSVAAANSRSCASRGRSGHALRAACLSSSAKRSSSVIVVAVEMAIWAGGRPRSKSPLAGSVEYQLARCRSLDARLHLRERRHPRSQLQDVWLCRQWCSSCSWPVSVGDPGAGVARLFALSNRRRADPFHLRWPLLALRCKPSG